MKAFVAVLRRELAERWLIPVAAALLGLVPLIAPLLPIQGYRGPDLRGGTAFALALITSYLLAVVLGSSVLARDLGERRLGFYFSRPLPGWAIWAGKLASALILALGSGLLIMLPSLLLGDRPDAGGLSWQVGFAANAGLWAVSVCLLVLLSNAAAVLFRSRSPWLLFDLAAAAVLAAWLWVEMSRLQAAGARGVVMQIQIAMLAVLLVALAAASAVQVLRARTDLRRGHRLLSLTLWGLLGAAALAVAGYGRWVLAASPEDLLTFSLVQPAPAGTWVAVSGPVEARGGYEPLFLLDTRSGRYVRTSASWWAHEIWAGPVFSDDGRRGVWLEPDGQRPLPVAVRRLDLDRPDSRPVAVPIVFDENMPRALSLSRDGRRLAAIHRERILLMDLDNGRNLASVPVPPGSDGWNDHLRFLESGALRFYGSRGNGDRKSELRVMDLDPRSGRVLRSFALPIQDEWAWDISRDGNHLLLHTRDLAFVASQVRIVDLTTGEKSPPIVVQRVTGRAYLLDDDLVVIAERAAGKAVLRLLDLRGTELRRFEIPADRLRTAGRPAPGLLVVSIVPAGRSNDWASRQCLLLDLDRGTWKPLVAGVAPAAWAPVAVGSLGTRLFFDNRGGLFELDPATGHRRVILHPEKK
ncbi:MAG TPA: hypothetical protein VH394_31500 [Thermoanaerobaculia bacterium]|jgi:type II secretory pathway pseudopilin PulG|nr:hypothetical protein [Thermoanaerobaculia bacterium]